MQILVLDDHPLMAQALQTMLAEHYPQASVEVCDRLPQAIQFLQSVRVMLALVDLDLPDCTPEQVLLEVHRHLDGGRLVVFSGRSDPEARELGLRHGAAAYISKLADRAFILQTLDKLIPKHGPPPRPNTRQVPGRHEVPTHRSSVELPHLSPRQTQVLQLLAQGRSNRELAQAMQLSENTVKVHLKALFDAIRVTSRTQAVARGLELGLISAPRAQN